MLQHELASVTRRRPREHGAATLILLLGNEHELERALRAGELSCPGCGSRVALHGFARRRVLRTLSGPRELAPRRARCSSCKKTHVVLPGEVVPRRRDDAGVIGAALLRAASGVRRGEIAAELGRSRSTVRNWLRRFADNAPAAERTGTSTLLAFDAHIDPMRLAWRPTRSGRAVEALGLAAAAVVRLLGPLPSGATPWGVANVVTHGRLLAPSFGP